MRALMILVVTAAAAPAAAEPTFDELELVPAEPCDGCKRLARKTYDDDLGKVEVLRRETEHGIAVMLQLGPADDRVGGIVFEDVEDGHAGSSDAPVKVTAKLRRFAFDDRVAIGVMLTETGVHTNDDGETPWTRRIAIVCDPERASCARLSAGGFYDRCHLTGWADDTAYPEARYACESGSSLVP